MKQEGRRLPLLTPGFSQSPLHTTIYTPLLGEASLYSFDKIHYPKYTTLPQFFEPVTWTKRPTSGPTGEGPQS